MPDLDYFRQHLIGAWRLLRGNEDGFDHFDISEDGFWRSFWAAGAVFIFLIPTLAADHRLGLIYAEQVEGYSFSAPLGIYVIVELATGIIGLIVFLMAMAPFTRAFGVAGRYATYVVAYNWASLLVVLLTLPLSLAGYMGLISWDIVLPFQLFLALVFLVYAWFIAHTALKLSRLDAAAVVALETLVVLILSYPTAALYGRYLI